MPPNLLGGRIGIVYYSTFFVIPWRKYALCGYGDAPLMRVELEAPITEVRRTKHFVFVVVPRFNFATMVTMIETMRIANYLLPAPFFSWEVLSFDGPSVSASNGMSLSGVSAPTDVGRSDGVFVLGSWGAENYDNPELKSWLRKRHRHGERICSVEMGCYIVARAGLLSGRRATTHWSLLSGFQESRDDIDITEQLYTIDGRILTCAGGLAGVDLMLRLIEEACGPTLSGEIADQMIYHGIRSETAPQRRTLGCGSETIVPIVRQAMTLIESNIEEPLTVPAIARELGVSQRQLERLFKKHVGCTVVQFSLLLRLQNARVLLISTNLSVHEIAVASGFNTLSHFAHAFGKFFGRRPSEYREAWPQDQAAPTWPGTLMEFLGLRTAKVALVGEK